MSSRYVGAATTAVVMVLMWLLPRLTRNIRSRSGRPAATRIVPEPLITWPSAVIFGAFTVGSLVELVLDHSGERIWWILTPFFGLLFFMSTAGITKSTSVEWSERSLVGPASEWGFAPWSRRNEIEWAEARRCGTTQMRSWFLESRDGRRVYWSYAYRGWGVLRDEIRKRRPDLGLPIEMG